MPQAVAAVVAWAAPATAATAFTVGATAVSYATIIGYTAVIGASVAYSSAQQKKLKKSLAALNSSVDQSRSIMVRDPIALRRYVQGQVLTTGPIVYMATSGTNNEYLHLVIVLSDYEMEELGDIYFGSMVVPLDGSGNATGTYAGYAKVKKFLGVAAGERDTDLETATSGEWTADHLGKGVARLHVTLKMNADLYPEGIPNIRCMVKGVKHYDPRTATTAYSANWALGVRTFLADEKFGKGIDTARILDAPAEEAANISDEDVVLADASTENRYELNGIVYSGDSDSMLADLCAAGAGHVCDAGGKWTIRAGAWRTPTVSLTEGDMCGAFNMLPRQSRQDTFNGVRGTFVSPINQWAPADFVPVKNDTYMGWDGGKRLWKDVAYNFTTSPAMAQRLAKIDLERGRQQIIWEADFMLKGIKVQPGDVLEFTKVNLGWEAKYFEVLRWVFKIVERNGGAALVVGLQVRETAAGVFDWNDGEETTTDLAENTTLANPASVATPGTPTLSTSNFRQKDGTISPRLKVEWTAPADARITGHGYVHIEYKKHADSDWIVWTSTLRGSAVLDYITDVEAGTSYDVRIRFENVHGVRGLYCNPVATATVSTDVTAPSVPTGLGALSTPASVTLDWDPINTVTDPDFAEYVLYRNTSNTPSTAVEIWRGRASATTDFSAGSGTKYYWVTSVDRTNNESAKSTGTSGVGNPATGNKIVNVFKRASSTPSAPTGNYVPSGWSDGPPAVDGNPLYISTAEVSSTGVLVGTWSTPVRLDGADGSDGADGASAEVEYSVNGSTGWHSTFATGDYYMRVRVGTGSWNGPMKIFGELEDGAVTTVKLANGAVSQVTAVLASSYSGLTNGAWTEIAAITVNAQVGQDVVLQAGFAYADEGGAYTTDFNVRILRDGTPIISTGQTTRTGNTDFIYLADVDPDLGAAVSVYSLEIQPIGGGGSATPTARDPFLSATILKDRLN